MPRVSLMANCAHWQAVLLMPFEDSQSLAIKKKNTSNTFQINYQQQACMTNKQENAHAQAITIEFSEGKNAYLQL